MSRNALARGGLVTGLVTPRERRVSRNFRLLNIFRSHSVTPRERRVSRNCKPAGVERGEVSVTPRERRVSRNYINLQAL